MDEDTAYILKSYLTKKHASEKKVNYYMGKHEYFPELFAYYLLEKQTMPMELKRIVEHYLELFRLYHEGYGNGLTTYYNAFHLKYRETVPTFSEMEQMKETVMKNREKYTSLIARAKAQRVSIE